MRSGVKRALELLGYYLGLDFLFYWLNRGAKRVLTFHNVMPDDLQRGIKRVGPIITLSEFTQIIEEIGRRFRYSVDIDDCKTVTITFDDGMLNEYAVAGKYLMDRNIPAILFVAGNMVGARAEDTLVIDQLLLWHAYAPKSVNKVDWNALQAEFTADGNHRGRSVLARYDKIYPIKAILGSLSKEWVRLRFCGVSQTQLDDLRVHGWIVGWHTKSHFPLGALNEVQRRDELNAPEGIRAEVMSYPYGSIPAVGANTLTIAKEMGYPAAFSNDPDFSPYRGKYFLMRLTVPRDKYELHFILSGFKYFLLHRRLLPEVGK